MLARRPEAKWRFSQDDLPRLAARQGGLTLSAAGFVKPGGKLIYSTCSIEQEECGAVAAAAASAGLKLLSEELTLPAGAQDPTTWRDGGYYAIFEVGAAGA